MERLRKLREPAAIVLLTAVAVQIVLVIVAVGYYAVVAGAGGAGYVAAGQLSSALVIAAAVVVVGCALWGEPTRHARALTLLGAVCFGVHAVLGFVLAVVGLFEPGGVFNMVAVLLDLLIPALAAIVLFSLHGDLPSSSAPQPSDASSGRRPPLSGHAPSGPVQFQPVIQPPRSQSDQFGNPYSNSPRHNRDYPVSETGQRGWQPVAQPGPRRLEPSPGRRPAGTPYAPPVGPQTRPEDRATPSGSDSQRGPDV